MVRRQVAEACGDAELTGWQPDVGTDGPQWFCKDIHDAL
jgi:hypothetical protein